MRDFGISPILCSLSRLKELGTLYSSSSTSSTAGTHSGNNGHSMSGKGDGLSGVSSSNSAPLTPVRSSGGGNGSTNRETPTKSSTAPVALSFNSFVKVLLQLADDIYGQHGQSSAGVTSPAGVHASSAGGTAAEETTTTSSTSAATTTTTATSIHAMTSSNENPMGLVLKVMDRSAGRSKLLGTSYATSSAPLFVSLA